MKNIFGPLLAPRGINPDRLDIGRQGGVPHRPEL